ncbi:MAG: glycosyltransferase, partial [Gammaproteobacteria bacterium]|nr:glycosyltransferase [Gammaproteobacteria bacterium]
MSKMISVVIPTHNNHKEKNFSLGYTLKSLSHQANQNFEIIVVNDRCTDNTIQKAKQINPDIHVVEGEQISCNLGSIRNIGARESNGEIIVFLDEDIILADPGVFNCIVATLETYDFTCGAKRYWSSPYWYRHVMLDQSISSIINTLRDISILPIGINKSIGFRDLNEFTFIGGFGAMRKDIFMKSGGFSEEFTGWGLEDTEYM